MAFEVIRLSDGALLPGIPTPRLIEAGRAEAYFEPGDIKAGGVWYLHEEPAFTSPDGKYVNVLIQHYETAYPGDRYQVEYLGPSQWFVRDTDLGYATDPVRTRAAAETVALRMNRLDVATRR